MAIKEYLRRVFPGTAEEFCQKAGDAMVSGKRLFVVTANPEILMHAGEDPAIRQLLLAEETAVVPDGISVVKAMNLLGLPAKERITGVDLADKLLRRAGEQGKSVYLLGAKEEVVSALAQKLKAQYPQMEVRYKNGYGKDKDADFREIEAFQPDLVHTGGEIAEMPFTGTSPVFLQIWGKSFSITVLSPGFKTTSVSPICTVRVPSVT